MNRLNMDETIAAIATPIGEGGIAVIRVSGDNALEVIQKCFKPARDNFKDFESHRVYYGNIIDDSGRTLDQVLVTFFQAPQSYTGENTIEVSSHGGMAVTRLILDQILKQNVRMAEPGEFTKRAFLNGKIDLTQAEAVIDLIKAKSTSSAELALKQLEGSLSQRLKGLKAHLMHTYAHMEAFVDFPEEDIEIYEDKALLERLTETEKAVKELIASFKRGALVREGMTCVIVGKPNVGKSSLFNAFVERDRALVSEYAGTTRDMLEESIEIGGVFIRLMDTAGLGHDSKHPLDQIGMQKTHEALKEARLAIFVVDGSETLEKIDETVFAAIDPGCPKMLVINKIDRPQNIDIEKLKSVTGMNEAVRLSTKTREGLSVLEDKIAAFVLADSASQESAQITRLRHKDSLEKALESLERTREAFQRRESLDLVTLDLKAALDQMSELTGEVYSEDLLDVIFSEFCIGK